VIPPLDAVSMSRHPRHPKDAVVQFFQLGDDECHWCRLVVEEDAYLQSGFTFSPVEAGDYAVRHGCQAI
jgi:hypothetical protein